MSQEIAGFYSSIDTVFNIRNAIIVEILVGTAKEYVLNVDKD